MEVSIKSNGNALINGKEYVPMARLEADIDEAVTYNARKKAISIILVSAAVIISFACGYALG